MRAELTGLLAGVTAARHEQQQEQRKIAQLQHQHEDAVLVSVTADVADQRHKCHACTLCC